MLTIFLAVAPLLAAQGAHDPVVDLAVGKRIFESQCSLCHGQAGGGGRGPALTRPKLNKAPDDAALQKAITDGLPPEMPGAWQLSPREVASVAGYVRSLGAAPQETLPGDAVRGAAVYRARGCAGCHIVAGLGTGRGPELTAIGARRNGAHLKESVLRPGAYVPDEYLVVEAVTATGKVLRGTRLNEDPFTIQLADGSGSFHSFRKSELQSLRRREGESTMPAFDRLSAGELDDLVAYLASLRGDR